MFCATIFGSYARRKKGGVLCKSVLTDNAVTADAGDKRREVGGSAERLPARNGSRYLPGGHELRGRGDRLAGRAVTAYALGNTEGGAVRRRNETLRLGVERRAQRAADRVGSR